MTNDESLEQLRRVSQGPRAALALAAGGSVAGRTRDPQGQLRGPGAIRAAHGTAASRRGRAGIQRAAARLVPWQRSVPQGTVGPDERAARGRALWTRDSGIGGGEGGAVGWGGVQATGLAGGRIGAVAEGRS